MITAKDVDYKPKKNSNLEISITKHISKIKKGLRTIMRYARKKQNR